MENVQGLQCRVDDGPTMHLWPVQHELFPRQGQDQVTPEGYVLGRSSGNESSGSHHPIFARENLNAEYLNASEGKDWKHSWEWDSVLLKAKPAINQHIPALGSCEEHVQDPSVDPLNTAKGSNGACSGPTLLEFGLNNKPLLAGNDEGLLALKLGGNGHLWGPDDLYSNVKRSRHSPPENQQPRCQVDNCTADLQNAKDYHRRHKVCEFHAKASKAPVSRIMQRFCQQCSRFHLLQEFDDDRRSCRRRLAGHNRRRRKTQPDSAAALACILADQSALSRIINPLGQLQGKDELERLLKLLGSGGDTVEKTLISATTGGGDPASKSIPGYTTPNELVNAIAKSQILNNVLLTNPNLACTLLGIAASTDAPISALSNALLLSLMQLQQKNNANANHASPSEMGRNLEGCMNTLCVNRVANQDAYFRPSIDQHQILRHPTTTSDKSNESNGDSTDERVPREGINESHSQFDTWSFRDKNKGYDDASWTPSTQHFQTASMVHTVSRNAQSLSPDEAGGLGSDHSSESGLDKQDQTCQLWFKIFDRGPGDLPLSLRKQMIQWLDNLPTEMEGYIRPGCIILTIFLCMPVHAWSKLCSDIEGSLYKLLQSPDAEFWRNGRVLVYLGNTSALIVDGKVYPNESPKLLQTPKLILVQPFAIAIGEKVGLILKGQNLRAPGTKIICAYGGKFIDNDVDDISTSSHHKKKDIHELITPDLYQEQAITLQVGPFTDEGHAFIEVESQTLKGNNFPLIVADKAICEELGSLEEEFVKSSMVIKRSTKIGDEIIHFLYELGWLLQRSQLKFQCIDMVQEFSPVRFCWLLRFSVEHSLCAVVKRILDLMFSLDDDTVNPKSLKVLSEANLLHVAVRIKSKPMVESLLAYIPANSVPTSAEDTPIFRPDRPSYGGLTSLHIAASMQDAVEILDALTNSPEEFWAITWMSAKDSVGKTPLMYAIASGNDTYVKLVQAKLNKYRNMDVLERDHDTRPSHLALSVASECTKSSSPIKAPLTNRIHQCACISREVVMARNLPMRVHGVNGGLMYRPLVLSILTVAAVCVCVGVLMKGPPSVNFVQGPFVWEAIRYGFM